MRGSLKTTSSSGTSALLPGESGRTRAASSRIPSDDSEREYLRSRSALIPRRHTVDAIGVAMPGIIRNGIVEDSPNLPSSRARMWPRRARQASRRTVSSAASESSTTPTQSLPDWRRHGPARSPDPRLDDRQWYRLWPLSLCRRLWEGGHIVVTLDPKENYCGCGGKGHLEGIMGHRAMRLRFLDMEPEEVLPLPKKATSAAWSSSTCWHRALAQPRPLQIHLEGPGKFYFTGRDIQRLDITC